MSAPGYVTTSQEALVHALVGAQYGDLEFDVGKSVRWTQWFTDDVFITDVNLGTPRYWIVNWTASFPEAYHSITGVNWFIVPEDFRREQFKGASRQQEIMLEPDDWVIFLDAHEGLSIDTRDPQPDDSAIEPFRSYLYREVARANAAGKDRIVLPFYVFLRHDDVIVADYQSPAFADGSLGFTTAQSSLGTPYYIPHQGLTRMMKVSVLQDPDFDWSTIDTPVPWNHVPDVDAYLSPTVGIASTPDPGPLPNDFTFVYKVRRAEDLVQETVCGQSPESGQRSWMLQTGHDVPLGVGYTWIWAASEDGDYYPYFVGEVAATATPWSPNDEVWAVSISTDDGSGQTSITSKLSGDGGATWTDVASDVGGKAVPFDSDGAVYIGEYGAGFDSWQGRIYWVEARTGLDPQAGTLLWRFDAGEYPGGGATSYVDPRGREWTLTSADAITPFESGVGRPEVKVQIVSYGYAHWNLQDIVPPATTVEPLSEANDDGWRMRNLVSMVRPIPSLPYGPWQPPSADPLGIAGPWAPVDQFTPDPVQSQPVTPDPSLIGLQVSLYDNVLRLNMRDGVWYESGQLGNVPLVWDENKQTWVPSVRPSEWQDGSWVVS